ncbi:MAG: SPOR domain-containing protein [Alphaproteobacteria bacterium]|nr:SPOR domain-containing protein [Alphaproteobacteria bacterium]
MKFFLPLLLLMIALAATPARAEEFYIELGRSTTEAEAKSIWETIRDANKKILGDYDVYPNQIIQPDGNFTYRIQAGPMLDKQEAERVCNRLFRRKVPCFVIEGFDPKKSQTFDGGEEKAPSKFGLQDFLPWAQPAPPVPIVVQAPEVEKAPKKNEEVKTEEAPKAAAKVDVAEAIAVPVTENNQVTVDQVTVDEAPSVFSFDNFFSSNNDAKEETKPSIAVAGWLSVQPFLNEQSAAAFWKNLRQRAATETKGLSMKMVHPVVSHDIPKVLLVLGTFPSEQVAMEFCSKYIAASRYLECLFSVQPPQGEEAGTPGLNVASHSPAAEEYSLFWVDVLSEKSQDKALEKWERIRTDNDDLLSDVRSQITTSLANPGSYMVRIGPLKVRHRATRLCNALKARKINCAVSTL